MLQLWAWPVLLVARWLLLLQPSWATEVATNRVDMSPGSELRVNDWLTSQNGAFVLSCSSQGLRLFSSSAADPLWEAPLQKTGAECTTPGTCPSELEVVSRLEFNESGLILRGSASGVLWQATVPRITIPRA